MPIFGIAMMGVGGTLAALQWLENERFISITASVLSSKLVTKEQRDLYGRHTTYRPVIEYEYEVNGKKYRGQRITSFDEGINRRWAQQLVDQHPPGNACTIYYNPSNPHEAILLRWYNFMPYAFFMMGAAFLAYGISERFSGATADHKPAAPIEVSDGWFEVACKRNIMDWDRACLWGSITALVLGGLAAGHFFAVATKPYSFFAVEITIVWFVLASLALLLWMACRKMRRRVTDVRMLVDREQPRLGETMHVLFELQALSPTRLRGGSTQLTCRTTKINPLQFYAPMMQTTTYQRRIHLFGQKEIRAGEEVSEMIPFALPIDQNPSSTSRRLRLARHDWAVDIRIKVGWLPEFCWKFPLLIHAPRK